MRGTLIPCGVYCLHRGIIPAYAGNTRLPCSHIGWCRDHPRICGEHRHGVKPRGLSERIIPAYAGNTLNRSVGTTCTRDHPRICGEHIARRDLTFKQSGSSPHMRGTLVTLLFAGAGAGIIPAYAGNTWSDTSPAQMPRDHPRICGEHPTSVPFTYRDGGSSPHMRGTPFPATRWRSSPRIIPAYAGNTAEIGPTKGGAGDHPRICGEHTPRDCCA